MGQFKKWIARLFNIQPEDLPTRASAAFSPEEINKKISQEVDRQVRDQLQQSLQEIVASITQTTSSQIKTANDQPFEPQEIVTEVALSAAPLDLSDSNRSSEIAQEEPTVESDLENEFPIIDEIEVAYVSEVVEQPLEQPGEIALPDSIISSIPVAEIGDEEISPLDEAVSPLPSESVTPSVKSIAELDIRIGIDFGTTTTAISIKVGDERSEALPIGLDGVTRYMPSIVYFQPGPGELIDRAIVGEEAERFGDDAQVIRSVKRCFGCQGGNCGEQSSGDGKPETRAFPWCNGDGKITISQFESVSPSNIAFLIIKEALHRAIKIARERWLIDLTAENVTFLPINLGCGAKFGLIQRNIIVQIAKELGFQQVKIDNIIEEPILAGYAFSRFDDHPEGRALIYDFGGGTFDVAIIDVDRVGRDLRVTVVSTAGENWLGGDDIDQLVYHHFLQNAAEEMGMMAAEIEEKIYPIDRSKLLFLSRKAKEQLSNTDTYSDVLLLKDFGTIDLDLTRNEFEDLLANSGLIKKSLDAVERSCKLAYAYENAKNGKVIDQIEIINHRINQAAEYIDRVILVGGITKIPYVRNQLTKIFGNAKIVQERVIEPISAVAIGGAYPGDEHHYSISVPPYGFFIEYEVESALKKTKKQTVFLPFEYYDFHKEWISGPLGVYFKDINLPEDYHQVRLSCKRAGDEEVFFIAPLGTLRAGRCRFSISLEGDLYVTNNHEPSKKVGNHPLIHPIQQAIKDARIQRQIQEKEEATKGKGDYEDWTRSMMNEN